MHATFVVNFGRAHFPGPAKVDTRGFAGGASVSLYLLLYTFFYQHRDLCVGLFGVLWILLLLGVCQVSSQIGLDT